MKNLDNYNALSEQECNAVNDFIILASGLWADDEELDWYALSMGFFLARGFDEDMISHLALIARYDLQYEIPSAACSK